MIQNIPRLVLKVSDASLSIGGVGSHNNHSLNLKLER